MIGHFERFKQKLAGKDIDNIAQPMLLVVYCNCYYYKKKNIGKHRFGYLYLDNGKIKYENY